MAAGAAGAASPCSSCSCHIAPVIPSLAVVAIPAMTLQGPIAVKFVRLQLFFSSSILGTTSFPYGESSS